MSHLRALLLAAILLGPALAGPLPAVELEGVRFPARVAVGSDELVLQGAGLLRYRLFVKAYVAALYLEPGARPERALAADVAKRLEIEYFWPLEAEQFAEATRRGIERNVETAALARLAPRIDRLAALYENVEAGDRYALTYVPGRGTELAKNGRSLGRIEGADFAGAAFAIWLGQDPLDEGLKARLLGP